MPDFDSIDQRIGRFKADLKTYETPFLVQKYITYGECFVIDQGQYFDLKHAVANHFGLHPSEVSIVGSGKLGFSIAPNKRYRPFGETSDIDIAIVSATLFEEFWFSVFRFEQGGGYWPESKSFKKYLFRGWIRPDKLPPDTSFDRAKDWWEFFRTLTHSGTYGPYALKAGLYRTWPFLEHYHATSIQGCRDVQGGD